MSIYTTKSTSSKFKHKVFITDKVHKQIKYLCQRINDVEWSGILVYRFNENENICDHDKTIIRLVDVIPMQKGSAGYTEYNFNERKRNTDGYDDAMIDYFIEHPEAMNEKNPYRIGMIHSHNSMSTFFSGTDTDELVGNGQLHDFYISLITNNNDENIAKIAFPSKTIEKVKTIHTLNDNLGGTFDIIFTAKDKEDTNTIVRDCDLIYAETESDYNPEQDKEFFDRVEFIIKEAELPPVIDPTIKRNPTIHDKFINTTYYPGYSNYNYKNYNKYKNNKWNDKSKSDYNLPDVNILNKYSITYLQSIISKIESGKRIKGQDLKSLKSVINLVVDLKKQLKKIEDNMKLSVASKKVPYDNNWDPYDIYDNNDDLFSNINYDITDIDQVDSEELAKNALLEYFYSVSGIEFSDIASYVNFFELNRTDLCTDIEQFDELCNYSAPVYNAVLSELMDYQDTKPIRDFINKLLDPNA